MKTNSTAPHPVEANFAFTALLFSVLGAALLESQRIRVHAGVRAHLVTAAVAAIVSTIAYRRCRLWWKISDGAACTFDRTQQRPFNVHDAGSALGLVAAGCVLALSAMAGSIAFFVICAGAFSLVPWSRIGLCRKHCFISCALTGAGAASVLMIAGRSESWVLYLVWAWVLHVVALLALLATYRAPKAAKEAASSGHGFMTAVEPVTMQSKSGDGSWPHGSA